MSKKYESTKGLKESRLKKYVDCFRYLSAERARTRWKSAGRAANPRLGEFDEDEEDFLSASHASTASDAFDFLFDSQNLNPEKVIHFKSGNIAYKIH